MSEPEKTVERSLLSPANIITAIILLGGLWLSYILFLIRPRYNNVYDLQFPLY